MKYLRTASLYLQLLAATAVGLSEENQTSTQSDQITSTESDVEQDIGARFPRKVTLPNGIATIYEPQVDSQEGYKSITLWTAVSYKSNDGKIDIAGALKVKADIVTDFDSRTVTVYNREILENHSDR